MIIECIKEGFNLTNKNFNLVFVRIAVSIINLAGIFLFLGLPVVAALIYLGFDLAQAKDLMPFLRQDPVDFITKYLGIMFLIGTSFIFYMTFTSLLFLYALGGTLGVLKNAALNAQYRFSLTSFFHEAKAGFSRLLSLISTILLAVIILFAVVMVMGRIVFAAVNIVTESAGTLEMFFSSFALLTVAVFSVIVFLIALLFGAFSVVVLVTDDKKAMDAAGSTYNFLKQRPQAFVYYLILIAGFIAVTAVSYAIQAAVSVIPFFAPLFYIINAIFHSYLALVLWSSLIVYYLKNSRPAVCLDTYEI